MLHLIICLSVQMLLIYMAGQQGSYLLDLHVGSQQFQLLQTPAALGQSYVCQPPHSLSRQAAVHHHTYNIKHHQHTPPTDWGNKTIDKYGVCMEQTHLLSNTVSNITTTMYVTR